MSVTTITSIHCDGCGKWVYEDDFCPGSQVLRAKLRKNGWQVNIPDAGIRRDYCPKCKDA